MAVMLKYMELLRCGRARGVNAKRQISARFRRKPERLQRVIHDLVLLCELRAAKGGAQPMNIREGESPAKSSFNLERRVNRKMNNAVCIFGCGTGPGIAPEHHHDPFAEFVQLDWLSGILDFSYDKVRNDTAFNLLLQRKRHYSTEIQIGTKIGCPADDAPPPLCSHRRSPMNVLREERPFNQGNKVGASSGP